MKQIQITYRKYFLRIPLKMRRFTIDIPTEWDELTADNLIAFCKEDNLDQLVISIIKGHAACPDSIGKRSRSSVRALTRRVNIAQRNDLLQELAFMTERPVMTRWVMPEGPGNMLKNLSLKDYGKAEARYQQYISEQSDENLDKLIGVLYQGDTRHSLPPPDTRKAILINYIACHNFIMDQNPNLYPQPLPGEVPSGESTNWLRIADEMAGDKMGTIDEVLERPCIAALQIMEDRAERMAEQRRSSDGLDNILNKRNE